MHFYLICLDGFSITETKLKKTYKTLAGRIRWANGPGRVCRNKAGIAKSKAVQAAFRMHGPIWRLVDLDGNHVPWTSSCHPCGRGRGKRLFLPDPEIGLEAPFEVDDFDCVKDDEDVMLADLDFSSVGGSEDIMIGEL